MDELHAFTEPALAFNGLKQVLLRLEQLIDEETELCCAMI